MTHTVLITGSNRGIGLEFVRQYADQHWKVHACCRNPGNADELQSLAARHSSIHVHPLDVTDHAAIAALASSLRGETIDLLINNAGTYGQDDAFFGNCSEARWLECFRINTIAPMKIMEAFVDHVADSQLKTMAAMTSKMGSMDDNGSGGSYVYRSSKAALNAVMKSAAIDLQARGIKIAILHPGWVKTDMGGPNAEISCQYSVQQLRAILAGLTAASSGSFFDVDGSIIPW